MPGLAQTLPGDVAQERTAGQAAGSSAENNRPGKSACDKTSQTVVVIRAGPRCALAHTRRLLAEVAVSDNLGELRDFRFDIGAELLWTATHRIGT